jgi:hypothetical protein
MGMKDVQHYLKSQPFRPFRLLLTKGKTFEIHHPEFAHVSRSSIRSTLTQSGPDSNLDHYITLSLIHVVELEHIPDGPLGAAS